MFNAVDRVAIVVAIFLAPWIDIGLAAHGVVC